MKKMCITALLLVLAAAALTLFGCVVPEPDPGDPNVQPDPSDVVNPYVSVGPYLGSYIDIVFDEVNNKLALIRQYALEIYDGDTFELIQTHQFLVAAKCIDADKGLVVVGFESGRQFKIYDMSNNNLMRTVDTQIPVSHIVIDGDVVIYTEYDQWCDIVFYSINQELNVKAISWSTYQPRLAINRTDHILYVCETGISSSALIYLSSQNGEKIFESQFSQFSYNYSPVYFDGTYVHYYGQTFNRFSGGVVSDNDLVRIYSGLNDYTKTLYESETLGLVTNASAQIVLYNNINNKSLFSFEFLATGARFIGYGRYFVKGQNSFAILYTKTKK